MFLTLVILNLRLPDWLRLWHMQKNDGEKRIMEQNGPRTLISCRSLDYACSNESIILIMDIRKPIEIYIYAKKKHSFTSYPAACIPPKTQQICHYRHAKKTSEVFLLCDTGDDFSSHNTFAKLGRVHGKSFRSCRVYNFLNTYNKY